MDALLGCLTSLSARLSMHCNLALLDSTDWAATPLGPRDGWPLEMQAVLRMAMLSGFPICTVWGDDDIQIYNDGYIPILGDKHPGAFAYPARVSWEEIWEFLAPALEQVRSTRSHLSFLDTLLPLNKRGMPEECYFDFSYSPVVDAAGTVLGMVSIAVEKTPEVIFQRRQRTCDVPLDTMDADGLDGLAACLQRQLADNPMDAAAAIFCPVDSRSEQLLVPLWTMGMEADALRPLATPAGSAVCQHSIPPGLCMERKVGPQLASIAVRGSGGNLLAMLHVAPHPLVAEDSHLEFARMLSDRVHRIVHHAEQIGRVRRDLADQGALYRYMFDNVMDAVIYACTDGGRDSEEFVLAANASACQLLGYAPGELIGLRRETLFFPDDAMLVSALAERERAGSFDGDLTLRRKDGSPLPVEVRSRLVRGADDEVRSVNIVRDISDRLQREAERASQARFEAIAQLTGGVAHDFNNLLTVMLGCLELLLETLPPDSQPHLYAANALLCAERGASLTSQLLSYSRRQPLHLQPVDINAHLEEMLGLIRSTVGEAVELELVRAPSLPACRTDVSQLTTALLNLAGNARDAMPSGGAMTIETCLAEQPGYVSIRVCDTGSGIPEALLGRVFEPYFTTKPVGSGSGLGLAMAQGFIRQCGGEIQVDSTPGIGTRFELTLPIGEPTPALAGTDGPIHGPTGEAILLVEDNDLVRTQVCQMLTGGGYRVECASSGREALALLARGPLPELVLTDLVMPGGCSGLQLANEATRLYPALPVLVMTGHNPWSIEGEVRDQRFEILAKPFDRRTLLEAIRRQWTATPNP